MDGRRKIWNIGTGARLTGVVPIHGNKNAALPALTAGLLLPLGGTLTLAQVPRISDVDVMIAILSHLGIISHWDGPQCLTLTRARPADDIPVVPTELISKIRGSIMLLGPLSGMYQSFQLPKPGGDKIGGRPIGAHMTALADLGVDVKNEAAHLACSRVSTDVHGGTVVLTEQSVTATLMLLLYSAFVSQNEQLTIIDAACEPHVVTLCSILEAMGAHIEGVYSNLLRITWPVGRHAPSQPIRLDDDFMEAATYAIAAAITKSDIDIPFRNAGIYLFLIDRYLGWMGVATSLQEHRWKIFGTRSSLVVQPQLTTIKAEPWPRFPTDILSMFVVLATQCAGTLTFVEYMYDDRFGFVQSLRDIGARIEIKPPHAIVVQGPTALRGNELFLRPDIRSGAAMLLAALASSGTTVLHDRGGVIERGYQELPETLALLGAPITTSSVAFDA